MWRNNIGELSLYQGSWKIHFSAMKHAIVAFNKAYQNLETKTPDQLTLENILEVQALLMQLLDTCKNADIFVDELIVKFNSPAGKFRHAVQLPSEGYTRLGEWKRDIYNFHTNKTLTEKSIKLAEMIGNRMSADRTEDKSISSVPSPPRPKF